MDAHVASHLQAQLFGSQGLLAGKTRIIATHHLRTIREADRVAMLVRGRLVEYGTYTKLTANRAGHLNEFLHSEEIREQEEKEKRAREEKEKEDRERRKRQRRNTGRLSQASTDTLTRGATLRRPKTPSENIPRPSDLADCRSTFSKVLSRTPVTGDSFILLRSMFDPCERFNLKQNDRLHSVHKDQQCTCDRIYHILNPVKPAIELRGCRSRRETIIIEIVCDIL